MRIRIIGFTKGGCSLAMKLMAALKARGETCAAYAKTSADGYGAERVEGSLDDWTKEAFLVSEAIVFIGAASIAVRSIAPHVQSKTKDPAVVVVDELSKYAIPILSGHLGRANKLAGEISRIIGSMPVITTASDINGSFSVDLFALEHGLVMSSMSIAKEVSARILDGKEVGLVSDYPIVGAIPQGLRLSHDLDVGICITSRRGKALFAKTLRLTPRNIVIGIGCKKGTPVQVIERKVFEVLKADGLTPEGMSKVASIDLKAGEPGLLAFCEKYQLETRFFNRAELESVPDVGFSYSEFVSAVTGVGNVCERSALAASVNGRLVHGKEASEGITVALAMEDFSVDFRET
jgi:cobalt-precorrin 5A hydrolase